MAELVQKHTEKDQADEKNAEDRCLNASCRTVAQSKEGQQKQERTVNFHVDPEDASEME
jgi:hypothetical protein